jgi:hypothetical protein
MPEKELPPLLERHWAESVLAIGAVVIAAVSLWVGYDSMRTNRELVASASWPFLQVYNSTLFGGPHSSAIYFDNAGIGPAKVEYAQLLWNGKPYPNAQRLLEDCCAYGRKSSTAASGGAPGGELEMSTAGGIVLRPGQTLAVMIYKAASEDDATLRALDALRGASFRVCYCSAFNQCWISNGHELDPREVSVCPKPEVPFQQAH